MANLSTNPKLKLYWNKEVRELVYRSPNSIKEQDSERHRIYSLLAMAATFFFWNGDKRGKDGHYPYNVPITPQTNKFLRGDYYGHNILALAVDFDGRVVDFEMNHNNIYKSSAEHAEARLVKRIYSLASLADTWNFNSLIKNKSDYNTFDEVSIYTTLESCSQCSGIMALAKVKEIIYLQTDEGMYLVGNILRNLTEGTGLQAPNPVDASEFGFEYYSLLNKAFETFKSRIASGNAFYIPTDQTKEKNDLSQSITSFLCTKEAYEIYHQATLEFVEYIENKKALKFSDYRPSKEVKDNNGKIQTVQAEYSNQDILQEVKNFYNYIIINERRGTPHK